MKRTYSSETVQARISLDHHAVLKQHALDCGRTLGGEVKLWCELGSMLTVWASLHAVGVERLMSAEDLAATRRRVVDDLAAQLDRALPHSVAHSPLLSEALTGAKP